MRLFLYEVTPQNRDSWSIYCNNLHLDQTHHWILKNKYRFSPTSFCHLKQDVRLNHSLQSYTQKKKKKSCLSCLFSCAPESVCECAHLRVHTQNQRRFFFSQKEDAVCCSVHLFCCWRRGPSLIVTSPSASFCNLSP